MAHMLRVAPFEIGDPMPFRIGMKSHDSSRLHVGLIKVVATRVGRKPSSAAPTE